MAAGNSNGIIINELLCFVTNKSDILPLESITQLCCSTFGESDIEQSKKLLYDLCADHETPRMITRKGPKKSIQNMEDIMKLVQEKGTALPTFVAHNLQLLPPIGFDSLDVSVLLNEIKKTQVEVQLMKEGMKLQMKTVEDLSLQVKADQQNRVMRASSVDSASSSVGTQVDEQNNEAKQHEQNSVAFERVGSPVLELSSAPGDSCVASSNSRVSDSAPKQNQETSQKPSGASSTPQYSRQGARPKEKAEVKSQGAKETPPATDKPDRPTYADIALTGEWKTMKRVAGKLKAVTDVTDVIEDKKTQEDEAKLENKLMTKKNDRQTRHINGTVKNTGLPTIKKKKYASIFASRFDPRVTREDLQRYLEERLECKVMVSNVKSRYNTYNSFHVLCECSDPKQLLCDDIWPEGAYVRWWRGDFQRA